MMKSLFLAFLLFVHCTEAQVIPGVVSASYKVDVAAPAEEPPALDNADNTNASNQQLWIIVGDSKARGTTASNDDAAEPDYASSVYEYTGGSVVEITSGDLADAGSGSMWPKFGQTYYALTGLKCVFLNYGKSGAQFLTDPDNPSSTNNWTETGAHYANLQTDAASALAAVGVTKARGIIIDCGVNDARVSPLTFNATNVANAINSLIERLQTDFPGTPIFVINQGRIESGPDDSRLVSIRDHIDDLPTLYDNLYIAENVRNYTDASWNFYGVDNLHYTQFGNDYLATSVVKYLRDNDLLTPNPISRTYDAATLAVFAKMPQTLTDYEKDKIYDFMQYAGRKSFSIGDSFKFFLLKNESNARQDWVISSSQAVGGTWNVSRGIITDGTVSGAIDTDFIPSTEGVGLVQNSVQAFVIGNNFETGEGTVIGGTGSVANTTIRFRKTSGGLEYTVNAGTATTNTNTVKNFTYYSPSRSSGGSQAFRINAVLISGLMTSVGRPNVTMYIGAHNNNGSIEDPLEFDAFCVGYGAQTLGGNMYRKIRGLVIDFMLGQ